MRYLALFALAMACLSSACSTPQKTANTAGTGATIQGQQALSGSWELNLLPVGDEKFNSVYPEKKPTLNFDVAALKYSGNTSCNNYGGGMELTATTISFKDAMTMTRMACPGEGERLYLQHLKRVNKYSVSADGKELNLIQGDIALMRFSKK